jgi:hypothetical protein
MHKKGENGNNMVESRDMEIKRDQERFGKRKVPPMLGGGGCETHIIAM